jgi:DNA-binding CsgD family transcriptional regulator
VSALYALGVRVTWPLFGRSEELGAIAAALAATDCAGVVVCGAAGVGKSRIAREALSAAALLGCETRWAVGTTSAKLLPLGAFAAWAPSGITDAVQLVRGAIESLTSTSSGATVVLGVDDVHLLDELSAFVLHQIVQRGAAKALLTIRHGDPIPVAIQEVWRAGQFYWLDLQTLSSDETAVLVSAALGGPVAPDAAQRLWELTRGNVLYLRNIVEQELGDGRLVAERGYWRWIGDPIVPPGLVELIEARIGALPTPVGEVVDALAVGEPIELASLRRITDAAAVEEADSRGLITLEATDGRVDVRVAHPLYGEVRRARTPPTRLRRLRGRVAAELAASDDRDDMQIVVRRGTLSLDSDLPPDADLLVSAARGALCLTDLPLADRLSGAAVRAGGGAEANFVRAHVLSWLSRGQEADAVLADIPTSGLPEADNAALAFVRAANRLFALGDPAGAKTLMDGVSHTASAQARSCIDAFLTVYWSALGKPAEARKSSKRVVLDQLPDLVGALPITMLVVASGHAGHTTEAVAAAAAGHTVVARSFDAAHMTCAIADGCVSALVLSGRIGEALDEAERLRQQAADLPGPAHLLSTAVAGRAALGGGRLATACALLHPVVEALTASGENNGWAYRLRLQHTIALGMAGSTDVAAAALSALEKRRHPSWRCLDYELALARAWVAARQGAVSEAITTVLSAAEVADANGQFAAQVICLQTAIQFGDRSSSDRLDGLSKVVDGPRVGVVARFAAALRAGDGAELAAVSREFEEIGDLVAAVDAAAHAALSYRRQGLRGSGLACSTRAEALAEQCGVASTPALRQASEPLPLTDREREIVTLIGEGLSIRTVAERLTLSVRTVESHIYRAMAKTGTKSRDELAALLPRHNPKLK